MSSKVLLNLSMWLLQGLVRSGPDFAYAKHFTKLLDDFGPEVSALITVQPFRDAIMHKKKVPQTHGNVGGVLVGSWQSDGIFCDSLS